MGALYALNDGQAEIYAVVYGRTAKGSPVPRLGERLGAFWFEYLGIRADEHYAAQQAGVTVVKRIRILRRNEVVSGLAVIIAGEQYKAGKVYHGVNNAGVPVTDISLEKEVRAFEA